MNDKKIEEQDTTNSFWEEQLDYFENRLKAFIFRYPINKARKYFSDNVLSLQNVKMGFTE
jgi:hypothetical protein